MARPPRLSDLRTASCSGRAIARTDSLSIINDIKKLYGDVETDQPKVAALIAKLSADMAGRTLDDEGSKKILSDFVTTSKDPISKYKLSLTRLESKVDELCGKIMTIVYGISNTPRGPFTEALQAKFAKLTDSVQSVYSVVIPHTTYVEGVDETVERGRLLSGRNGAGVLFSLKDAFTDKKNDFLNKLNDKVVSRKFGTEDKVNLTVGIQAGSDLGAAALPVSAHEANDGADGLQSVLAAAGNVDSSGRVGSDLQLRRRALPLGWGQAVQPPRRQPPHARAWNERTNLDLAKRRQPRVSVTD